MLSQKTLWNRNFLSICLSSFFLFITYYALIATLPVFVIQILKGGQQQIGLTMTSFIIAAVLFRPLAGKWLDELGKRKILLLSSAVFFISSFMYLGVKSLVFFLILRFIHGISFGFSTTAMSTLAADIVPEERKGEGIGYFALFMNLAMVVGPFLGLTILNYFNFNVLFIIFSVLSVLSFLFGSIGKFPSSKIEPNVNQNKTIHWKDFFEPSTVPIALTGFLLSFAYSSILSFISVYAKELGLNQVASYFFVVYALIIVISRPFTGKIFDRLGEHTLIYPCLVIYAIGLILLSLVHSPIIFLLTSAIIGLGYGSIFPSFQAIAIKTSPIHRRGIATATYFIFFDTGMGLGSFILGTVASSKSYSFMYLVSSFIVILAIIVYYFLPFRLDVKRKNSEKFKLEV